MSVRQLQEKVAVLNKVVLASRFEGKEESSTVARNELDKTAAEFATIVHSDEAEKIKAAVEEMHSRYKALAKVSEES